MGARIAPTHARLLLSTWREAHHRLRYQPSCPADTSPPDHVTTSDPDHVTVADPAVGTLLTWNAYAFRSKAVGKV